jgi:hypothetical protein
MSAIRSAQSLLISTTAVITLSGLALGVHYGAASYGGDSNYLPAILDSISLTVTASSAPPPAISQGGLVGAARFTSTVSPGELASIFGSDLSTDTLSQLTLPFATILAGVQVRVNGQSSPLLCVSPSQINFQIPSGTPVGTPVSVVVVRDGAAGPTFTATLTAAAPGIFMYLRAGASGLDPVIVPP